VALFTGVAQIANSLGQGGLISPDIAGIANDIKTFFIKRSTGCGVVDQLRHGLAVFFGGSPNLVDGVLEDGIIKFSGYTQGRRQIEMSDPQGIKLFDRSDFIDILDTACRFDQGDEGCALVGSFQFLGCWTGSVAIMGNTQCNATSAHRRIFHIGDDLFGFGGRPYHGQDQTVRTDIQCTGDMRAGLGRWPHQAWHIGGPHIGNQPLEFSITEAGMFHVDKGKISASLADDLAYAGGIEFKDGMPDLEALAGEQTFEIMRCH